MLMERQAARIRRKSARSRSDETGYYTRRNDARKDDRKTSVARETAANVTGRIPDDGDGIAMLVRK